MGDGLNITGEHGSIEINKREFKAESEQQDDTKYETSPEFKAKEVAMSKAQARIRRH